MERPRRPEHPLTATLLDAALDAHAHGFAVVPPAEDGTKRPVGEWKRYQTTPPTEHEIRNWYGDGRHGIGVVCGAVSGNLEMLEFEGRAIDANLHDEFSTLAAQAGLTELVDRVFHGYSEWTPTGGLHLLYRVDGGVAGNTKLARRPATAEELAENPADKVKVLVETRGEGGYVITAPSHGPVHPDAGEWRLVHGGWSTVATVTAAERDELHRIARALDRMPRVSPALPSPTVASRDETRPGDSYNAQPDVAQQTLDLLIAHGWTAVFQRGDDMHLRRPGKQVGTSAVLHLDDGTFYVFSSSTVFEPEEAYSPFAVFTILEHDGDYSAAARALRPPSPSTVSLHDLIAGPTTAGEYGPEAWRGVLDGVEPEQPQSMSAVDRLRSILLDGVTVKKIKARRSLVKGWLDLNSLAVLYGRSGGGKSFVAIDFVLHVVTGSYWQGHKVRKGTGLYVVAEGATGIGDRQTAWEKHNKHHGPIEGITWLPSPVNLLDPVATEALILVAAELRPSIVVIDTLARSMSGGDENAGKDMSRVIEAADRIKVATGACVLIVHHSGKDETRGGRGWSGLTGALDTELELKSAENILTLSTTKMKDDADQQPLRLTLVPQRWACPECEGRGWVVEGEECDRCDGDLEVGSVAIDRYRGELAADMGVSRGAELALDALRSIDTGMGVSKSEWQAAAEEQGIPKSSLYRHVKTLVDAALVRESGTPARPRYSLIVDEGVDL